MSSVSTGATKSNDNSTIEAPDPQNLENTKFGFTLIATLTIGVFFLSGLFFVALFVLYGCTQKRQIAADTREVVEKGARQDSLSSIVKVSTSNISEDMAH